MNLLEFVRSHRPVAEINVPERYIKRRDYEGQIEIPSDITIDDCLVGLVLTSEMRVNVLLMVHSLLDKVEKDPKFLDQLEKSLQEEPEEWGTI